MGVGGSFDRPRARRLAPKSSGAPTGTLVGPLFCVGTKPTRGGLPRWMRSMSTARPAGRVRLQVLPLCCYGCDSGGPSAPPKHNPDNRLEVLIEDSQSPPRYALPRPPPQASNVGCYDATRSEPFPGLDTSRHTGRCSRGSARPSNPFPFLQSTPASYLAPSKELAAAG